MARSGYGPPNNRYDDHDYDEQDSGISGDNRRGRSRNRNDWPDERRRNPNGNRNYPIINDHRRRGHNRNWNNQRGGNQDWSQDRDRNDHRNDRRPARRDIGREAGPWNNSQNVSHSELGAVRHSMSTMSTNDRTRVTQGKLSYIREQAEGTIIQQVSISYMEGDDPTTLSIETKNPRVADCNITYKDNLDNSKHSHFAMSVLHAQKTPTQQFHGSNRMIHLHETLQDLAGHEVYGHYAGENIFSPIESGDVQLEYALEFPWTHKYMIGKPFSNYIELNTTVSILAHCFDRLGVKEIHKAPFTVRIFYVDSLGNAEVWTNQKGAPSGKILGVYQVLGIQIMDNLFFLAFMYFNNQAIPDWSPFRYIGEHQVLRHIFSFINDRDSARNRQSPLPKWQAFLAPSVVRDNLRTLYEQFYTVISKCGNSLTTMRSKDNHVLGLLPISLLFSDHSSFMRLTDLIDTEKEVLNITTKYSADFRIVAANGKAHRFWELDNVPNKRLPEKTHKELAIEETDRLSQLREKAPHTLRHIETGPAKAFLQEKETRKIATESEKILKCLPVLAKNTEYVEHFDSLTATTLANPVLAQKISKQLSGSYTKNITAIQCKVEEQEVDLKVATHKTNQLDKVTGELKEQLSTNDRKILETKAVAERTAEENRILKDKLAKLELMVENLTRERQAETPKPKEPASAQTMLDSRKKAASALFGRSNPGTQEQKPADGEAGSEIPPVRNIGEDNASSSNMEFDTPGTSSGN